MTGGRFFSTARTTRDFIADAIDFAIRTGNEVKFKLCSTNVVVNGDSDLELILRDLERAESGCITGAVGPNPSPTLSDEELRDDALIKEIRERQRQRRLQNTSGD